MSHLSAEVFSSRSPERHLPLCDTSRRTEDALFLAVRGSSPQELPVCSTTNWAPAESAIRNSLITISIDFFLRDRSADARFMRYEVWINIGATEYLSARLLNKDISSSSLS